MRALDTEDERYATAADDRFSRTFAVAAPGEVWAEQKAGWRQTTRIKDRDPTEHLSSRQAISGRSVAIIRRIA